jgi:hypothetical protein
MERDEMNSCWFPWFAKSARTLIERAMFLLFPRAICRALCDAETSQKRAFFSAYRDAGPPTVGMARGNSFPG